MYFEAKIEADGVVQCQVLKDGVVHVPGDWVGRDVWVVSIPIKPPTRRIEL